VKEPPPFNEAERQALQEALKPLPIDPARVQETLRLVANDARTMRLRRRLGMVATAASVGLLVAAGYWRWNGMRSADLTIAAAIDIVNQPGAYEVERVRAARGKIHQDLIDVLRELRRHSLLSPSLADTLSSALDVADPIAVPCPEGFEQAYERLRSGGTLTARDEEIFAGVGRAGILAIRSSGTDGSPFVKSTLTMSAYLRELLREPSPHTLDPK